MICWRRPVDGGLVRGAELSGAQFHARPDAVGDGVLFYHSSCAVPGVAGMAEIASAAYPDASQFDRHSPYFDPKATLETPRWVSVDVTAVEQGRYLPLAEMREMAALEEMVLLQKGSRLSVSPVTAGQWRAVLKALRAGRPYRPFREP